MSLQEIFQDYSIASRKDGIDGSRFLKLCTDTGLINSNSFRKTEVDLVFAKFKEQLGGYGAGILKSQGFVEALKYIAAKKQVSYEDLVDQILSSSPKAMQPNSSVTKASKIRFHDDQSTYTGVHKAGGPTTVDRDKKQLQNVVENESEKTPNTGRRGSSKVGQRHSNVAFQGKNSLDSRTVTAAQFPSQPLNSSGECTDVLEKFTEDCSMRVTSPTKLLPRYDVSVVVNGNLSERSRPENEELYGIYQCYVTGSNPGIDSAHFLRFCKDFNLFDSLFRQVDVDVVFSKNKTSHRFMSYGNFLKALFQIATKKNITSESLELAISSHKNAVDSSRSAVVPLPTKFHDDQTTYTGVHKAGGPKVIDSDCKQLDNMVRRGTDWTSNAVRPRSRSTSAARPKSSSVTKALPTRLHDNPSTFTGVHRHGGPSLL